MSTHIGGAAHGGAPVTAGRDGALQQGFRAALARWASGVAVVSVRDEPHVFGVTATSFASVSLEPPLVLFCLGPGAIVLPILEIGTQVVVNVLAGAQQRTATVFTDTGPLGRELFPPDGPPIIEGSLASLVCSVDARHAAGDHSIVVARVHDVVIGPGGAPLVRYDRAWHTFDPAASHRPAAGEDSVLE